MSKTIVTERLVIRRIIPADADTIFTYRNDPGAPEDPSGQLHYGATEWRDVEAAAATDRFGRNEGLLG